jgi:hypothetical protein
MVFARANAELSSGPGGVVTCIDGDVADVVGIAAGASAILDLSQPTAILLLSTLAHVPSAADAAKVVAALMDAAGAGSHLAIYHLASDLDPAMETALKHWNSAAPVPIRLRSRDEIAALAVGLDLVPPGVVPVNEWRPDENDPLAAQQVPVHGLVARTPA